MIPGGELLAQPRAPKRKTSAIPPGAGTLGYETSAAWVRRYWPVSTAACAGPQAPSVPRAFSPGRASINRSKDTQEYAPSGLPRQSNLACS